MYPMNESSEILFLTAKGESFSFDSVDLERVFIPDPSLSENLFLSFNAENKDPSDDSERNLSSPENFGPKSDIELTTLSDMDFIALVISEDAIEEDEELISF